MQDDDELSDSVEIPEFMNAWARIQECHASATATEGPMHLRLLGQSGLGKTFILKHYVAAFPKKRGVKGVHIPVVRVRIPSAPTVKGIYGAFLRSLGVTGATGSLDALRHRALVLCNACHVELIFIDELNHLTDRGQIRTREAVGDAIKEMLDTMNRPTVLAGASRSLAIFESNMQLRSRVMATLTLHPFNLKDRFEALRGFIEALSSDVLDETAIRWLSSSEVASRIFFATDGIHRTISTFITNIHKAVAAENCAVDYALLARLFVKYQWEKAPPTLNPFHVSFPMRRLCSPGEPYAPSPLDGDNHIDGAHDVY